ncbi:MAG: hypothetical protein ACREDW_00160 [Aestuariivirgaceae bacterium]
MDRKNAEPSLARRLLWFVFLWLAGVTVVGAVSLFVRALLM